MATPSTMLPEAASLRSGNYCLATFPSKTNSRQLRIVCAAGRTSIEGSSSDSRRFTFGGTRNKIDQQEEEGDDEASSNGALNFGQLLNFSSGKNKRSTTTTKGGTKKELSLSLGLLRRAPDARTVFVAGATGQIGARISQQLLRGGFTVRCGVRDLDFAQQLAEFATQYGVISRDEARKLNAVEFDFQDVESIAKAMGNAGKVVVTVGAAEDGPMGRVTARDALQVVEAARVANVGHVVVVTEAGGVAGGGGGPLAAVSDLFSKLFFVSKGGEVTTDSLLDSVVDTDLRFTFVRVSSTEVDDFKPDGTNLVLLAEGTYSKGTGKVSKSQLASVVAGILGNVSIAENKVVEVATVAAGASKSIEELLSAIPEDGRRNALAEAKAKTEAEKRERVLREQAEAEAERALDKAKKAVALADELEEEAQKLARQEAQAVANAQKAKEKAKAAAASLEELGAKIKDFGSSIGETSQNGLGNFFKRATAGVEKDNQVEEDEDEDKDEEEKPKFGFNFGSLFKGKNAGSAKESPSPAKKVATSSRTRSSPRRRTPPPPPPPSPPKLMTKKPARTKPQSSAGKKSVLGGLFKQDTIYIDE